MTTARWARLTLLLGGALGALSLQAWPKARGAARSATQLSSRTAKPMVLAAASAPVQLGPGAVRATLKPADSLPAASRTLDATIESLGPDQALGLVLRGVHANKAPGVVYRIYLDLPADTSAVASEPHYIGTLNFYNAVPLPGADAPAASDDSFDAYDITDVAKHLFRLNRLTDPTVITIVPVGRPADDARASITRIEIDRRPAARD